MGENETNSPPAHNVVDPYGGVTVTVGVAAPSPGAPAGDANNVMTLHVPNANTTLSLGGVGPMTEDFEKGTSPGFNLQTAGDFNYQVTGNWKGEVGANVAFHFLGTQEVETEQPWLDVKHSIQVEFVAGATQETFVGLKQETMLGGKHELIVGGEVSHVFAYKNEFTTGWVNETINGPETKTVNGLVTETVNGNETKTVNGNVSETIIGNETKDVTGTVEETLHGNEFKNVYGNVQEMITGTKQEKFEGKWTCEGTIVEMLLESNAQIHAADIEFKASGGHKHEGANVESHGTSSHKTEAPTVSVEASGKVTAHGGGGAELSGSGSLTQIDAGSIKTH